MQNTTNYNLLIPEGTDIVNPLTQVNPNFQTIDGAMFANKQGSIGTATEVVTGVVHAIVRNNTDSDVFRFTSTGSWTAGDSMTVDGVGVTVHLSDGTAPQTGAYIIGAEVLAMIKGTLVTLAISTTPPAQGVTSFNSRIGAVTPQTSDYDASMIDYDNTTSGLTSTDVQSAIDEIQAEIVALDKGKVSVTADGVLTMGTLLTTLFSNATLSNITKNSVVTVSNSGGISSEYELVQNNTGGIIYNAILTSASAPFINILTISYTSLSGHWTSYNSAGYTPIDTVQPAAGDVITLYY